MARRGAVAKLRGAVQFPRIYDSLSTGRLSRRRIESPIFNARRPASAPKWLSYTPSEQPAQIAPCRPRMRARAQYRAHSRKDFAILSYLGVVGARRIVSSVTCGHFSHWTVLKGLRLSLSVQVALWAYTYLGCSSAHPSSLPPPARALSFSGFFSHSPWHRAARCVRTSYPTRERGSRENAFPSHVPFA